MEYSLTATKNIFENNFDHSLSITRRESSATVRCRICLDSTVSEELIAPCYCTGTIGLLHKNCLEKWLNLSKSHICEICGYEFKVSYTSPTLIEWFIRGGQGENRPRRRHLWTDCICLFIMLPLMTLCAWLTALSGRTDEGMRFSWQGLSLGSLFGILFCVFFVWLVFSVRYHRQSWQLWRKNNQHISLCEYRSLNEGMPEQPHLSIYTNSSQTALNPQSTPVVNIIGRPASLPLLLEKQISSAIHSPSEHNVRSLTLHLLGECRNERRYDGNIENPMTIHHNRLDPELLTLTTSRSAPSVITEKTRLADMNMVRVVDKIGRTTGVPIAMQSIIPLEAILNKTAAAKLNVSSELDPVLSETC